MSNLSVIARMLGILNEYEADHITPEQVHRALEFQMEALEGISLQPIHKVRTLTNALMSAHMFEDKEVFIDEERVRTIVSDLRSFLLTLPKSPTD